MAQYAFAADMVISLQGRDGKFAAGVATSASSSATAGLFGWWQRQIRSLVPSWAFFGPAAPDAIIVHIQTFSPDPSVDCPATGQISIRRSGQEQVAAQLDFSRPSHVDCTEFDTVILRIPPKMVLQREMTIPVAAERDLPTLIHFQMPQLTPFDAKDVFWGISEPARDQARLKLTLHVVKRDLVDRLLGPLAEIGLKPSILEDSDGGIILGRFGGRDASLRGGRLGICFALAVACLSIPFISQQVRLDAAGHRLRILFPVERQITRLHWQIANLTMAQSLIDQAEQSGDVFDTLARLTNALPDGTWLNDLTVDDNIVTFDGQSSDAAQLISMLTATPGLKNVSFNAPVTRTPDGGADMFSIQLSVLR